MAERRMFSKSIIDTDAFLELPLSAQALYFHLSMRADDEGFVAKPKSIQRLVRASDDDLKLLIAKRYILAFDTGVIVIKHWKIHNYIRGDRLQETNYLDEKSKLTLQENMAYTEFDGDKSVPIRTKTLVNTECLSDVSQVSVTCPSNVSIGKDSIGKDSIGKDRLGNTASPGKKNSKALFVENVKDRNLSEPLIEKLTEWIEYKVQRKEPYVERGIKSFLTQMEKAEQKYGTSALIYCIDTSMSRGYKGIITDIIDKKPSTSTGIDWANV